MRRAVSIATVLISATLGCGGSEQDTGESVAGAPAASRSAENTTGSGMYWTWWTDNDDNNPYKATFTPNASNTSYTTSWDFTKVDCSKYPADKCPRDFVGGMGWTSGLDSSGKGRKVKFNATWNNPGGGCLGIYGWMGQRNSGPKVEYYICDATGAVEGPHNSSAEIKAGKLYCYGNYWSDGSDYTVCRNTRVDKPSIFGDPSTFDQYIAVRVNQRTSGTINVDNHFVAWRYYLAFDMTGTMTGTNPKTYQTFITEAWGGYKGSSSVSSITVVQ